MKARMQRLQRRGPSSDQGTFFIAKHMIARPLDKQEEWRQWRSEVEDYCEMVIEGTNGVLEGQRSLRDAIDELDVKATCWSIGAEAWRLLRRFTSGEARRSVTSVDKNNGWEAWRRLHQHSERGLPRRGVRGRRPYLGGNAQQHIVRQTLRADDALRPLHISLS